MPMKFFSVQGMLSLCDLRNPGIIFWAFLILLALNLGGSSNVSIFVVISNSSPFLGA
jgi:hypothetical protein